MTNRPCPRVSPCNEGKRKENQETQETDRIEKRTAVDTTKTQGERERGSSASYWEGAS